MDEVAFEHVPVLLTPVVEFLSPQSGQAIFDGTVGFGGHAGALLPCILPGGRYIGVDLDTAMLAVAERRLRSIGGEALELRQANFADLPRVLESVGMSQVDHILLDLGVNSAQLADATRGFSFERDGPLDMRFDRSQKRQALDLVNSLSERELADLFYEFGQEGMSRKIARRICQMRHGSRITTTQMLARAVESAFAAAGRSGGRTHPATRVFQALRVAVNRELENLRTFLDHVTSALRAGGTLVIISFHSLEDGMVKRFLRDARSAGTFEELTREPVIAEPAERERNPRSRSAKLRAARRTAA